VKRRRLLEERIEWLETFPRNVTVGSLLRSLRMVANIVDVADTTTPLASATDWPYKPKGSK
jgi:hypothetical protein